jgi:hypothetical protein
VTCLYEVAHSRSGDKGDVSDISVIAYRERDFAFLCEHLTAARVRQHFAGTVLGDLERYMVPQLLALKFVLHHALGGGVTRSLRVDTHGKGLSSRLLELELPQRDESDNG